MTKCLKLVIIAVFRSVEPYSFFYISKKCTGYVLDMYWKCTGNLLSHIILYDRQIFLICNSSNHHIEVILDCQGVSVSLISDEVAFLCSLIR